MARRSLLILAAVFIGGVLLVGLVRILVSTPGAEPSGWRSAVQAYTRYEADRGATTWQIAAAEQAIRPWEFLREMSARTFGGSTRYQVDVTYTDRNGVKPPPMPPVEVWCVHLKAESASSQAAAPERLVFVARHQDLYNADWITHEPSPAAAEMLTRIGCR